MLEHGEPVVVRIGQPGFTAGPQLAVERFQDHGLLCLRRLDKSAAREFPCPHIKLAQPRLEALTLCRVVPISEHDVNEVGDARVNSTRRSRARNDALGCLRNYFVLARRQRPRRSPPSTVGKGMRSATDFDHLLDTEASEERESGEAGERADCFTSRSHAGENRAPSRSASPGHEYFSTRRADE